MRKQRLAGDSRQLADDRPLHEHGLAARAGSLHDEAVVAQAAAAGTGSTADVELPEHELRLPPRRAPRSPRCRFPSRRRRPMQQLHHRVGVHHRRRLERRDDDRRDRRSAQQFERRCRRCRAPCRRAGSRGPRATGDDRVGQPRPLHRRERGQRADAAARRESPGRRAARRRAMSSSVCSPASDGAEVRASASGRASRRRSRGRSRRRGCRRGGRAARATTARLTVTFVLPTPPLPLVTATVAPRGRPRSSGAVMTALACTATVSRARRRRAGPASRARGLRAPAGRCRGRKSGSCRSRSRPSSGASDSASSSLVRTTRDRAARPRTSSKMRRADASARVGRQHQVRAHAAAAAEQLRAASRTAPSLRRAARRVDQHRLRAPRQRLVELLGACAPRVNGAPMMSA